MKKKNENLNIKNTVMLSIGEHHLGVGPKSGMK